jgi:hypothetical protein
LFRELKRQIGVEEEEVGGFIKNPRRIKIFEEDHVVETKVKKKMTSIGGFEALQKPEVREQILGPETRKNSTPVNTTPLTTTEPPANPKPHVQTEMKKETKMPEFESCPICGGTKPIEIAHGEHKTRPLVCKACSDKYHIYAEEVATKLANGETVVVLTRHEWILNKIDLQAFALELNAAFREKEKMEAAVAQQIRAHGVLPREVFVPLQDKLRKSTGAAAAFGKWRKMQERLKAATEVKPQVEKMVAEEAARTAAMAPSTT